MDMIIAGMRMISECARIAGSAMPITTRKPVQKRPKSITALEEPGSMKSSGFAQRLQTQFGRGART